jgi:signal transduction histidine kinase
MLVAAGLRFCGGLQSPLWIVLFVVVVAETILSPQKEARLVRWCVGVALVAGTWSPGLPQPLYWLETGTRLFFLIVVSMITRRLRERQEEKNAELATLRSELALAGERTRLSREIHDGVGNALAAAVLRLEVAARMSEKQRLETGPVTLLREEAQALREAMNAVRDWTFFTRPWPTAAASSASPTSGTETFGRILEREAARLGQRTGLPVMVEGADALDGLPEPARIAALRITQEALTNAAKYANAQHAWVFVRRDGNGACLTIRDDGKGFDLAEASGHFDSDGQNVHRPGIGLTGMRERAELLGGTLEVIAAPGAGVTVCARFPLA